MDAAKRGSRSGGRVFRALLVLAWLCSLLVPEVVPAQERPVEEAARSFVAALGYAPEDAKALANDLEKRLQGAGPGRKGADLTPVETAMLLLDLKEKPLSRVRYLIQLSSGPDAGSRQILVEIARYNLGPAVRQDAVTSYGARNVGSAEEFGIGPHVVWRLAFQPGTDGSAELVGAGRKTLPEREAKERTCASLPCLGLEKTIDGLTTWTEQESKPETSRRPYPKIRKIKIGRENFDEENPAYTAFALALAADLVRTEGSAVTWTGFKAGAVTLAIERNLGQDLMSDAAAGPLDAARPARWVRRGSGVNENAVVGTLHQGHLQAP